MSKRIHRQQRRRSPEDDLLMYRVALLVLILVPGVFADSSDLRVLWGGDSEAIIYLIQSNDAGSATVVSAGPPPPIRSGGSSIKRYYDVKLEVTRPPLTTDTRAIYTPGRNVEAVVSMDYIGNELAAQDGILEYTVITPDGEELTVIRETLKEGNYKKILVYDLPDDAQIGAWAFHVTWTVPGLAPITAQDTFIVQESQYGIIPVLAFIGLFIILCIIGVLLYQKRKVEAAE